MLTVSLEAHVAPPGFSASRLSLLRGAPDSQGSAAATSCSIEALRAAAGEGWNPGQSGVFTVAVTLPRRPRR